MRWPTSKQYDGVTGHMVFDPNQKNVAPMYLGTVHDGAITYRVATMEKQRVSESRASQSVRRSLRLWSSHFSLPARKPLPRQQRLPHRKSLMRAWVKMAWIIPGRIRWMYRRGRVRVVLFGPRATEVAQSPEIVASLPPHPRAESGSCCQSTAIRIGARLQRNWFMR